MIVNRRVIEWEEWPRRWSATLECGHVVPPYDHDDYFTDKEKERIETETNGYPCFECAKILSKTRELQEKIEKANAELARLESEMKERT